MNFTKIFLSTKICFRQTVLCLLCGVCKEVCPTKALNIANNTPIIDAEKCSWCASCAKKCPTGALAPTIPDQTEKEISYAWLLPPSLYGMEADIKKKSSYSETIHASAEYENYFSGALRAFIENGKRHPVILSACPSVVRFIRIALPQFSSWLYDSLPPMELSAKASGIKCTFTAPCPAKIADIQERQSREESSIDQVLPANVVLSNLQLPPDYLKKITPKNGMLRIEGLKALEEYLLNWKEGMDGTEIIEALSCPDCSEGYFLNQHKAVASVASWVQSYRTACSATGDNQPPGIAQPLAETQTTC